MCRKGIRLQPKVLRTSLTKDKEEELRRALEGASGAENGPSAG